MNYKISLEKNKPLTMFSDEMSETVDEILKLPYGIISLFFQIVKDIFEQETVTREDWEIIKGCYFIIGVLMTKKDRNLVITEEDIAKVDELLNSTSITIVLLENVLSGMLEASYNNENSEWVYRASSKLEDIFRRSQDEDCNKH